MCSWLVAAILARQRAFIYWAALLIDKAVSMNRKRKETCIIHINQLHLTAKHSLAGCVTRGGWHCYAEVAFS